MKKCLNNGRTRHENSGLSELRGTADPILREAHLYELSARTNFKR